MAMSQDIDYLQEELIHELEKIVGPERVLTDQAEKDVQSIDVWWITRYWFFNREPFPQPFAIVFPECTEEVVRLVRWCNEHQVPYVPRGGGAGDSGGSWAIHGGLVIDLKRMDKILELNKKSLTVRVQSGIIQKHLEEYLNRHGYTMNHFPASFNTSALGGFISTNGTGVLSSKYGKVSDMVHQLEVVLPNGTIFKSLPVRLHSTGPDYSRLFFGAEGTLGIITEALCKIYPLPERRTFRSFILPSLSEGIEAGRKIMVNGLMPCLMRLYDEFDTRHILKNQFGLEQDGCVLMTGFDGLGKIVDAQMEVALDIMQQSGGKDIGEELGNTWWTNRYRSYYPPLDYICEPWMTAVTDTVAPYENIEKIYWEMKKAVEEGFQKWNAQFHAHFSHWYDWGTSFYPTFLIKNVPEDKKEALSIYHALIDACVMASIKNGGVINEHHGIGLRFGRLMKEIYGDNYNLALTIKNALDPDHLLNPGKLGLGD
ncbi:MAG: FAD-binding oxidoreductase [Candidatus Atribacteria bacterium]|nr:FAD-binding oxidoreductase [Candidatus Atribacteria bacterium]